MAIDLPSTRGSRFGKRVMAEMIFRFPKVHPAEISKDLSMSSIEEQSVSAVPWIGCDQGVCGGYLHGRG
jgi:hypothetical protein